MAATLPFQENHNLTEEIGFLMDALKSYMSGSSDEEENTEIDHAKQIKADNGRTQDNVLTNTHNKYEGQVLKSDFFNLQDSDSSVEEKCDTNEKKLRTDMTVSFDKGEIITLPENEFWKPLTRELKEYKETMDRRDNSSKKPYQNCSRRGFKRPYVKETSANNGASCQSDTNCIQSSINIEQIPHAKENFSLVCNKSQSSQNLNIKTKLFDLHGKIKPWIHKNNIFCKIPRKCEKTWKSHDSSISRLKWNVSKYSHLLLSVSMDTSAKIWNVWNNIEMCVRLLQVHSKGIQDGDWSNSGRCVLTCSYDKSAVVSDVETGQPVTRYKHKNFVTCGKFHPTNDNIFLTGSLDELTAWDTRQNDEPIHTYTYKDKIGQIQDVLFSKDGKEFFSSGDLISRDSADRNIMAWDFDNAIVKSNQIYQERYSCTRLKLHPTESTFMAQTHGNYVALFSANKPYKMYRNIRYEGHKLGGYKVGFDISHDGRYIVSGDAGGALYCYDYKTGQLIQTLDTKLDINLDVAYHPLLPSTVACCGWNGCIELWN